MRRLPGDPCNPTASQECYFGQKACVGFSCLGWLENGTCTTERDCIGGTFILRTTTLSTAMQCKVDPCCIGMECRCFRQGCSTSEQVCRPRLRSGRCGCPTHYMFLARF
jgi:hypothetical protein